MSRKLSSIRLGINVDHVATLRQARGTSYPDPVEASLVAASSGGDSITMHLREDRRHIQDHDIERLLQVSPVPLNFEMAITPFMLDFACRLKPKYVCLVPEKREELTTEGGLDVAGQLESVKQACARLAKAGIEVALFIDADPAQLKATRASGAPHIEIHTGGYADARGRRQAAELERIAAFARNAKKAGLEVHAGHGLTLQNVAPIARIAEIEELNIGHSIVSRAVFVGFAAAVAEMKRAMTEARRA
ncbi:pyridoxine 5'-phosphate synthase [Solimonas sp. K1W22B-7]|uniref:pyridoxine 5'-phosphate synthase n=1 Tax=Solimonas sp. K1W22B-7 TaxID=2303331 RepID=UPI000E333B95|nr:pyridoxine 5'-phosphate synthase [Solimonas sp. K1W22B-7]AXQ31773.1 pyridoxine 5'-phosphate synthase [Solimonas sp. K1W22B-7]